MPFAFPSESAFAFAGILTTLLKVEQEVGWGLSLSPDSRWLLYPQLTSVEWSDLMLVENFR
jgi:hypothetical protein